MQHTNHIIVLVIPKSEIFFRLARYARECLSQADFKVIIAAQVTLSLWEHFKRRRIRVGIFISSLEIVYCLLEGYISPWVIAADRLALRTADRPDVILSRTTFSRDLAEACSRHGADVMISMGCEKIDLSFFPLNFNALNIHPGILPAYRGVGNPEALLKSDFENLGYTIHKLTMDLDQGGLIVQVKHPELKGITIPEGYLYCYLRALELMAAEGGSLLKGPICELEGSSRQSTINCNSTKKNVWHLTILHFFLIKYNLLMSR